MADEGTLSRIRQSFCEEYVFRRGKAILILLDNYVSKLDFCFPPYCFCKLQPLDRTLFGWRKNCPSVNRNLESRWQCMAPFNCEVLLALTYLCRFRKGFWSFWNWPNIFTEIDFALSTLTNKPEPHSISE